MRRLLAARLPLGVLFGLSAACLVAGTVFAWPTIVEGRPDSLRPGAELGYYFWHQSQPTGPLGPGLVLVTTGPEGQGGHLFEGTIETDGQFVSAQSIRPERADGLLVRESEQRIRFQFRTFSGIDGVSFVLAEPTHLILQLQIDGQPASNEQIFLGQGGIHPVQNPVVLYW